MITPAHIQKEMAIDIQLAGSLKNMKRARTHESLAELYEVGRYAIRRAERGNCQSLTPEEVDAVRAAREEFYYLSNVLDTRYSMQGIADRHGVCEATVTRLRVKMIDQGQYRTKPERPTLSNMLRREVDMSPEEFRLAINVSRNVLQKWWSRNPLLLKLVVSGYKREVQSR